MAPKSNENSQSHITRTPYRPVTAAILPQVRKVYLKEKTNHDRLIIITFIVTTAGSEAMSDDEPMLSESEDSNDSWTTEEFSSEFIMKYGVK